jgi:NADH-quinone oxidoreductase subunit L
MTVPLMALAVFAVIAGFFNLPPPLSSSGGGLHHLLESVIKEEALTFNVILALFFGVLAIGALWLANTIYKNAYETAASPDPLTRLGSFYNWSLSKFKLDEFYQLAIIKPFYAFSSLFAQVFDLGGIDATVNGVGNFFRKTSDKLRNVQTGFVRSYGLVMLAGVIIIVAYFVGNVGNVK